MISYFLMLRNILPLPKGDETTNIVKPQVIAG